jgi:hypothetical protein
VDQFVEVLLLTSELDFATDKVCLELALLGVRFLRLNREQLSDCQIVLNPLSAEMTLRHRDLFYCVGPKLRSIWWRQGTFDRNLGASGTTIEEQLSRTQWGAFMRSMMVFENVRWINNPAQVYRAETKAVQLNEAIKIGFDVPLTVMTNELGPNLRNLMSEPVALKSIDTLLLREGGDQLFGYTTLTRWFDIADEDLRTAPVTIQAALEKKLDLRVTLIGDSLWCVSIKKFNQGIEGDWRLTLKKDLQIDDYALPPTVSIMCRSLLDRLGLRFGAIDLALADGKYWFIEINPTGEWGWLDRPERPVASSIAKELSWV